jgi:hypothetical protein
MKWWVDFVWLRMLGLRVYGAAIDRAAALLALDDPGQGQPQNSDPIIPDNDRRRNDEK